MIKELCFSKEGNVIFLEESETGIGLGETSEGVKKEFVMEFLQIPVVKKKERLSFLRERGWVQRCVN